jgi:hypothetical protein
LIPFVEGECYIVKKNFHVDVSPATPFKSKHQPIAHVPRPDPDVGNHATLQDVVPNVRGWPGLDEQITEL